ncbi:receptor-type tyrosine-protein phosphatase epsilon-like [Oratosquilla oratoria]|uniref:receptor-type tyrosine-protein phosphatase epsilon-like n=1 Tax=Oratosquilla oratoria TaxID=337810 RepID=UPI003F767EB4
MVYEKNASLVVLLTNIEDENFIPLIPSLSDQRDWKVHVHVKNSQTFTYFKEVNVSVISKSSGLYSHEVQLVIFTAWPLGCTIPTPNAFLTMLEYIQALKKPKPILLCCPDGVTGCGLTAAFLNILAKVQQMEEVDIYHAVQTILHDRPQFINHLTQLEFLYDASLEYIQNHSIYNNFYRV